MLRSRVHNIRTGLSKLNTFSKQVASATGGGFLPPKDPPKVSFELTPTVREFAAVIAIKLSGLPACADSDGPTSPQSFIPPPSSYESLGSPIMAEEENDTTEVPEEINESAAEFNALGDTISQATEDAAETTDSGMSTSVASTLTSKPGTSKSTSARSTPTLTPKPSSSKQFFATIPQQERKRQRDRSSHYYDEKAALVGKESERREELHTLEMKIKEEELATKQQITAFWKVATEKLSSNVISIGDVVSLAAIHPPSINLQASTDPTTETLNLDDVDIEYTDGEYTDREYTDTGDVTLALQIERPQSPKLSDVSLRESPSRQDQMHDSDANESIESTIDNEDSDPTFKPKHSKYFQEKFSLRISVFFIQ